MLEADVLDSFAGNAGGDDFPGFEVLGGSIIDVRLDSGDSKIQGERHRLGELIFILDKTGNGREKELQVWDEFSFDEYDTVGAQGAVVI